MRVASLADETVRCRHNVHSIYVVIYID